MSVMDCAWYEWAAIRFWLPAIGLGIQLTILALMLLPSNPKGNA